jgi:hypothetical protein
MERQYKSDCFHSRTLKLRDPRPATPNTLRIGSRICRIFSSNHFEGIQMESLRSVASASQITPTLIRVRALAGIVGMTGTISLSKLMAALLAPVSFHANITTPSGTALGGTVDITLSNNGNFSFNVHMHDSGYDPYDFRVRCAVQSPGGLTLLFQTSGHTDGTGSDLLGSPNRDFNHNENGFNAQIKAFWLDVRASSMSVSKSYQDSGVLSTLEDVAKDLLGFLIADVTFGAGLALAVCVSADLANAFGASFVGPGGLVGVVTAGGVVWTGRDHSRSNRRRSRGCHYRRAH